MINGKYPSAVKYSFKLVRIRSQAPPPSLSAEKSPRPGHGWEITLMSFISQGKTASGHVFVYYTDFES